MVKSFITIIFVLFFLGGCGSSQPERAPRTNTIKTVDREKALGHFVNGSIYDQKGDYANAVLEYQDALRYDRDAAIYFAMSKSYTALRKFDLAAQAASEAINLEPKKKEYYTNLAEIYISSGAFDSAIKTYDNLIQIDSTNYNAWYALARLYQFKTPSRAIQIYNKMEERFGVSWEVSMQLSELYRMMGMVAEAMLEIKKLRAIDSGNIELTKALAEMYLASGKSDSALVLYNDIVELFPTDIETRAALTHLYLLQQDYQKAASQFDLVLKGDVLSIADQLQFGQIFLTFIQKDSAVAPYALNLFEKIRNQYPSDWRPYLLIGHTTSIMKLDSVAIENFNKVTELDKQNPDGWVYLALVYYEKQDFTTTIKILEEAKNFVPDEFRVYLLLGVSYQRMQKLESAAIVLEKAIGLDQKNLDALSALALIYDDLKRYEESDSLYEKALRLYPNNHLLLNNYAYSLSVRNIQIERALLMAQEAIKQEPKNPSYLDTMGWIYFQIGDYKSAYEYISQAIEAGDVSSVVLEHLGDVYFKLGNKEKAIESWQSALQKDLHNKQLQEKIERGSL